MSAVHISGGDEYESNGKLVAVGDFELRVSFELEGRAKRNEDDVEGISL